MYNRYLRNEHGAYTRIPEEDAAREPPRREPSPPREPPPSGESPLNEPPPLNERHPPHEPHISREPPPPCSPPRFSGGTAGPEPLRRLLDQFHLDRIDTGDLLLLGLLYLLYREKADEELLISLGLLLIL